MTTRQQIINAVIARLQTITTGNGYSADLGSNIFEWPALNISKNKLPAAIVSDPVDQYKEYWSSNHVDRDLRVEIELIAKGTPDIARELAGDVLRAIGTDYTFGGLAMETEPVSIELDVKEEEYLFSGASIALTVKYRTEVWTA